MFLSVLWSDGDPESYAIVSDSLEHDKRSVAAFLTKIVEDIQEKHLAMRVRHIFSDGAASQFKNKLIWCFLSTTFKELFPTLRVQWHFFATSHGKGAVDGVGATVKRAVNTDVLSRQAILVTDAASLVDSARKSCPNTKIKLIASTEITDFIEHHRLDYDGPLPQLFRALSRSITLNQSHGEKCDIKSTPRQNSQVSIHFCFQKSHLLKVLNTSPLSSSQQLQRTTGDQLKLETVSWSNSRQTDHSVCRIC